MSAIFLMKLRELEQRIANLEAKWGNCSIAPELASVKVGEVVRQGLDNAAIQPKRGPGRPRKEHVNG